MLFHVSPLNHHTTRFQGSLGLAIQSVYFNAHAQLKYHNNTLSYGQYRLYFQFHTEIQWIDQAVI